MMYDISIHAPRMGSDSKKIKKPPVNLLLLAKIPRHANNNNAIFHAYRLK